MSFVFLFVQLVLPATLRNSIVKIRTFHDVGLGNTLKSFISAYSIYENTVIESGNFPTGQYDTVLPSRFLYNATGLSHVNFLDYDCWRWRVLKIEEVSQTTLENDYSNGFECDTSLANFFSSRVKIDLFYNRALLADAVFTRIYDTIRKIQFRNEIINTVDRFHFDSHDSLAVSVRTWTAEHEHNVGRRYSFDEYATAISHYLTTEPNIRNVLLSVDNPSLFPIYMKYLSQFSNVTVIPLFRDDAESNLNSLQKSVVKMLLMSKCRFFICSRVSTFSELVFWFSGCTQKVTALF